VAFRLDPLIDRMHRVLDLRQEQHALTASNLANADTPDYKARVIDFSTALTDAMGDGGGLTLRTADGSHLAGIGGADNPEVIELEAPPWAEDGNSVFAERETSRLVANQLVYNGVAKGLSKHMALLKYAASDGRL
jgi:flagellar basal-body rod protein FlgB